ncbi:MAG TPA: DNA-binding protein [Chloroflexota bacterium]|nr:DNA-binding protein [Chloroflexota bacterium]
MTVGPTRGFPKGVSAPAIRALESGGYHDLSDLANVPIADLKNLHGMGPKAVRVIQAALAERGLSLRGGEEADEFGGEAR